MLLDSAAAVVLDSQSLRSRLRRTCLTTQGPLVCIPYPRYANSHLQGLVLVLPPTVSASQGDFLV